MNDAIIVPLRARKVRYRTIPTMEESICTLPVELVDLVIGSLDREDVQNLRRACWALHDKTLHWYASRYLARIRTDFSKPNLSTIYALSKKPARVYVRLLTFEALSQVRGPGEAVAKGFEWKTWGDTAQELPSDPLGVECLRNLRDNLKDDLVNCRSFGLASFEKDSLQLADVLAIFIAILADTQLPVQSFYFRQERGFEEFGSKQKTRIDSLIRQQPGFSMAWAHVQELNLNGSRLSGSDYTRCVFTFQLVTLIECALNLQTLRLSHLYVGKLLIKSLRSIALAPIQNLELTHIFTGHHLSDVLYRLRATLRTLKLAEVCFGFTNRRAFDSRWDRVFQCLADLPALQKLSISQCHVLRTAQVQGGLIKHPYIFRDLADPAFAASTLRKQCVLVCTFHGDLHVTGIEYSGPDMRPIIARMRPAIMLSFDIVNPDCWISSMPIRAFGGKSRLMHSPGILFEFGPPDDEGLYSILN